MPSKVDIFNLALRMVGGTTITSFSSGTPNSNIADDVYDETLQDMLRYPWNFARKSKKLAQLVTTPISGYDHAYNLPDDWVYSVALYGDDNEQAPIPMIESTLGNDHVLMSNHDEVWLVYVYFMTDPNMMPADFRKALASNIAAYLAIDVVKDLSLYDRMEAKARRDTLRAKSTDALNSTPNERPLGSWVTSRYGWRARGPRPDPQ